MKRNFLDTNIFIEVFARNGDKSEKCKKLLKQESILCSSSLVISELEWVLRYAYRMDRRAISIYIKQVLLSDIEVDNKKVLINTLNLYESHNVDWTDCLNMFLIKDQKISEVYSYDKGLKVYGWITRLEP